MKRPERDGYPNGIYGDIGYVKQLNKYCSYLENKNQSLQLIQTSVINSPIQLEPVLAEINHITDLGLSKWFEVVYFDEKWNSYSGSKTFEDGEQVIKWKYCKDC